MRDKDYTRYKKSDLEAEKLLGREFEERERERGWEVRRHWSIERD